MVECTRLEIWRTFRRTVSSNLTLSASKTKKLPQGSFFRLRAIQGTIRARLRAPLPWFNIDRSPTYLVVYVMSPVAPHPVETSVLADDLRLALRHLVRRMRQEEEEDGSGLTLQQKQILYAISQHPGIGVAELARIEKVRGATMSGHIKALELAALVHRAEPDPTDRRRAGLLLTQQGAVILAAVKARRQDWLTRRLEKLPPEGRAAIRSAIAYLDEIAQ